MAENSAMSISFKKSTNKTNLNHNNRSMTEKQQEQNSHIDYTRSDENIYLKQNDLKELYEEEFGEALEKYNQKQRRNDRKIDSYYQHIKNSKKTALQQEMIVQIGDKDDALIVKNRELANEVLQDWFDDFEERNPNLKVYNAVIHNDEATPHLHLNFVPVASGYKRGLEKQVAFDRAIKQQDKTLDKDRPFADWREKEVNLIADRLKELGIERKVVGTNDYKDVNDYKKRKDLERDIDKLEKKIALKEKDYKLLSDDVIPSEDEIAQLRGIHELKEVEVPTGKRSFFGLGKEITELKEVETGNVLLEMDKYQEMRKILKTFKDFEAERDRLKELSNSDLIEEVEQKNHSIKLLQAENQNVLNEKNELEQNFNGLEKENTVLKQENSYLRREIYQVYQVTRDFIKQRTSDIYAFKNEVQNFVYTVSDRLERISSNPMNLFGRFHDNEKAIEREREERLEKTRSKKQEKVTEVNKDQPKKEKPMFSMKEINERRNDKTKESKQINKNNRSKGSGRSR